MKSFKGFFPGIAVLGAIMLGGCFLNDGGSSGPDANLVLNVGVKDVNNLAKPGLAKSATGPSGIILSKLIVTLTSSILSDAVIRDTILADTGDFVSASASAQQVLKSYAVKPLRNWSVQVKTLDVNDSVIHISSASVNNVKVGQNRLVTLTLSSRFVVYVAKFTLPDSIGSQTAEQKQKLYVNRFVMVVDGDTVRDTTSSPVFFAATPASHFVEWSYVRADTVHSLELYVYADSLGDWDPTRPIFGDTIQITSTDTTYTPVLPWTGPGAPNDPDYDPANPGGARAGLTINIGPVPKVMVETSVDGNPLPKRKD